MGKLQLLFMASLPLSLHLLSFLFKISSDVSKLLMAKESEMLFGQHIRELSTNFYTFLLASCLLTKSKAKFLFNLFREYFWAKSFMTST